MSAVLPDAARRSGDSVRRLAEQIKKAVTNGDFRAGTSLPKFDYFRTGYHVTQSTIAHALRILAGSGLVHGAGRRWVVGPSHSISPALGAHQAGDERAVIFLAFQNQYTGLFNYNTSHLAPFLFAMRAETSRLGIHFSVAFREQIPENNPFSCSGADEVRARMRELGNKYLGAIIIDEIGDQAAFTGWVKALSGDGARPVVFFDSSDTRPGFARSDLDLHKRYYRAFFNEGSAVRLALEHCRSFGHRTLGFPVFDNPGYSWAPRRRDRAMEIAREIDPAIRIIPSTHTEPFWDVSHFDIKVDDIVTFAQRVSVHAGKNAASRNASIGAAHRAILRATPSIARLLDAGATALISMNDRVAHEHYSWCRAAGIEVPRRLSMISFDNLPDTESLPVTTVDFGFPRLGYLAIHAIIGDVPVPCGRDGAIAGQCLLVSRGSVERL